MPAPSICTVSGVIYGPGAAPLEAIVIKAYVTTGFTDMDGNYIPSGVLAETTSDINGEWSLDVIQTETLARSVTFQFEYPLGNNQSKSVKYACVIPDAATADFADLVDISTGDSILHTSPTTDALPEGVVNLYFTVARAQAAITGTTPITVTNGIVAMPVSTNSVDGYLSAADHTSFAAKQPAGNYITGLTGDGTASGPGTVAFTLSNTTVTPGSYTNADITVDSKGRITAATNGSPGGVTTVTASAPLSSSGGATPDISITQSDTSTDGYLSATDWNTFNNKQSSGLSWLKAGNASTSPGTDYIGTSDAQDLIIKTNNQTRLTFDVDGGWNSGQTVVPVNSTTDTPYFVQVNANPSGNTTSSFVRGFSSNTIWDQPNAGFNSTGGVSGLVARAEHNGSGTLGFLSIIDASAYFGSNAGTTTLYKGINFDVSVGNGATVTDYYGISNTVNFGTSTLGNVQLTNISNSSSSSAFTNLTGLNVNPSISTGSSVANNVFGIGSYPSLDSNGTITGSLTGIQTSPSAQGTSTIGGDLIGSDVTPYTADSASFDNFIGQRISMNMSDTSAATVGVYGLQVTVNADAVQPDAKGVDISLAGVDVTPGVVKYGLNVQDGAISVGSNYIIPGASTYLQTNYIGGADNVAAGDPTATFGFGINLAKTVDFQDDWTSDPSGLGYNGVGFVGAISGGTGKTMYSWTGALGGAGNPSGAGTLTNATMFKAAGILPQGGSLSVTNMYGFQVDPNLFGLIGTNTWGFYEAGSTVENHLSKLAIDTATKKVANSDTAFEIGSAKMLIPGRMDTATKTALIAVEGAIVYDTDTQQPEFYDGSAWSAMGGGGGGTGWELAGNAGTTAGTDFVGTTDAQDLVLKRNSTEKARLTTDGFIADTIYGSTSSAGNAVIRSTSNATKGIVKIANQTGEKSELGPIGSVTAPFGINTAYVPSGSSLANSFVVQDNSANLAFTGTSGAPGIALIPNFGTLPEIRNTSSAGRMLMRSYSYGGGGELGGYFDLATNYFGFQNSLAGYRVLNISGTTGQSAELVAFYNQTSYANQVAAIGNGGQFRAPAGSASLPGHSIFGDNNTGMFAPAADTLAWSLGGTEKIRLDSTGLGIGVTPSVSLDAIGQARIRGLTTAGPVSTDSSGNLSSAASLAVANGGTGQTSYTDGQLLIGNSTGNTLTKTTLTAGTGISITNGSGSITIASSATSVTFEKDKFTLTGTDISNGYLDLSQVAIHKSVNVLLEGAAPLLEGATEDYTLSNPTNTRVTFSAGILATMSSGQKVQVIYAY